MTNKSPSNPTRAALDNLRIQNPIRPEIDPGCYDLAVKFLKADKWTDEDRTELAEAIQETIEDFISTCAVADVEFDDGVWSVEKAEAKLRQEK